MEKEIEDLEIEKTTLKYKLRDIFTLYSKEPGGKFKI
jgi:hypothetical protein